MIFDATPIEGTFIVRTEKREDQRGFFARTWCRREFAARGIDVEMVQASVSYNRRAGTLRGLHFAWPPSAEAKLVRCARGQIFDVVVDLRPESASYMKRFSTQLGDQSNDALYIPHGLGHGFQTLVDDCEVEYMMTAIYRPDLADGFCHDDPAFRIEWPLPVTCIAERDRSFGAFDAKAYLEALSARRADARG